MNRDINVMAAIQAEKAKEIATQDQQQLNAEGEALAEHKRFTLDIVDTPSDPLR